MWFCLAGSLPLWAQNNDNFDGKIALTPVLENEDGSHKKADNILLNKLKQVITANGMADLGYSRFIITANTVVLNQETTPNVPPKVVVNFSLTFYVGDSEDGRLFGSYSVDLKGIGKDMNDALVSGYKKFNPSHCEGLSAMIEQSKKRITEYYNTHASTIITKAQAAASSGNYAECYSMLLSIPEACSQYQEVQNLLVKYRGAELDATNKQLLDQARAAYSASPNEEGAGRAADLLSQISFPSEKIRTEMASLNKEIAARLNKVADQERQDRIAAENNAHKERLALINGAARVAEAQAKRPVYHIHRWGWW